MDHDHHPVYKKEVQQQCCWLRANTEWCAPAVQPKGEQAPATQTCNNASPCSHSWCTIQCKRVLQCARAGGSHTAHNTDGTQVGGTYLWVSTWPPYFIRRSWLRSFDRLFDTSPVLAILSLSQCASSPWGPVAGWPFINKLLLLILSKVRLNTPPPIVAFLAFQTLRPSEFFLPAVVSGHLICSSLYMCRMLQYGIVQVQTTSF